MAPKLAVKAVAVEDLGEAGAAAVKPAEGKTAARENQSAATKAEAAPTTTNFF